MYVMIDNVRLQTLCEVEQGLQTRFNDAKCDASGRLWAGTMGLQKADGSYTPSDGSLYTVSSSGESKTHLTDIGISNGLAWSHDNQTMFYIDSIPRKVYAFDYDIANGAIGEN